MVKISIGVMVLVVLFTLSMCKCGGAFETSPAPEQGTIGGGTSGPIGGGEARMVGDTPAIGDQTPAPHPDKTKQKKAVNMDSGTTPIMSNSGHGQYPTPVLVPEQEH